MKKRKLTIVAIERLLQSGLAFDELVMKGYFYSYSVLGTKDTGFEHTLQGKKKEVMHSSAKLKKNEKWYYVDIKSKLNGTLKIVFES